MYHKPTEARWKKELRFWAEARKRELKRQRATREKFQQETYSYMNTQNDKDTFDDDYDYMYGNEDPNVRPDDDFEEPDIEDLDFDDYPAEEELDFDSTDAGIVDYD
jgi:hypothetical protein